MLRLARPTGADWAPRIASHLDEVLVDHAHLEKKAASTALQLMFRYPNDEALMQPLSALAREELEHFEQVLGLLADRGVPFVAQVPSAYAGQLHSAVRKGEPHRQLDTLLCCALIEARSCERMKLLSQVLPEPLAAFYGSLLESEARHHSLYVDHAIQRFGKDVALSRLTELAEHESDVIEAQPQQARLHSQ
jgi:tRNA 2-(methylsulfanyl)-N6-isopentenyladenosine37 hydroxylase